MPGIAIMGSASSACALGAFALSAFASGAIASVAIAAVALAGDPRTPRTAVAPPPPAIRVTSEADLARALAHAKPGHRIAIAPGTYRGFSAANVQGTADAPIELHGERPDMPSTFTSTIHLSDAAHVVLSHVVVTGAPGNGVNVDDGGTADTPAHHVTLRHVHVHDIGGTDNADGIKLSGVVDFRVEDCTIERWGRNGSGIDMVGCRGGVIERCVLRDQPSAPAASGVQAKGGSRDVAVRACRFEHAGQRAVNIGGSTGMAYFRPRPEGFEARDITVEGCTIVGSPAPIAFVGVDGATVRWNTIYMPAKWVARILQESTAPEFVPCRNGVFADNLVVYRGATVATAVNVGPHTAPETFAFARNYWYAVDDPARSVPALPCAEVASAGGADPRMRNPGANDPRAADYGVALDSPARAHGAGAWPGARATPAAAAPAAVQSIEKPR